MSAAAAERLQVESPSRERHAGSEPLDESRGFLGLGRSLTFPFPQWRANDRYRTVYFDEGEGPAIVFVHGLGANATHWEPLAKAFVGDYRVIGLDLVGCGWSLKPDVTYTVDLLRDHLLSFLDDRGVERATLVGHSMGGAVTLSAALTRPLLAERLVLIDAAGVAPLPRWMRLAAPVALRRVVLFPFLGLGAKFILKNVFVDEPDDNPMVRWFHESALRDAPGAPNLLEFARVCETLCVDLLDRDESPNLPRIDVPVLAIWGDHDKLTTLGPAIRRIGAIPKLRTVIMKNTGHMPMIERADETIEHIRRFLDDPPDAFPPTSTGGRPSSPSTTP